MCSHTKLCLLNYETYVAWYVEWVEHGFNVCSVYACHHLLHNFISKLSTTFNAHYDLYTTSSSVSAGIGMFTKHMINFMLITHTLYNKQRK